MVQTGSEKERAFWFHPARETFSQTFFHDVLAGETMGMVGSKVSHNSLSTRPLGEGDTETRDGP